MARNPDLVRTILAQPNDDTARLVYADWLDENGDPKHAELIRVQCELAKKTCVGARRKTLTKREAELLSDASFHLPGQPPFQYARGFISESCTLTLTGKEVLLDMSPIIWSRTEGPRGFDVNLEPQQIAVLDRALGLKLNLCGLPARGLKWDDSFITECLARVTGLECWEGSFNRNAVKRLTKCPHLSGVTSITFDKAGTVPLGLIVSLFLSPALPNITSIHLDGEDWFVDDGDTDATQDDVAAFVTQIGASPKAAQLTNLQLNCLIGDEVTRALIDAPHLRPAEQLCLSIHRGLKKPMKDALKKKFGKALIL